MKKNIIFTTLIIIAIIIILWITTIIPKLIAKQVAINYTKNINMWLKYDGMEYNKYYGFWNVYFKSEDNNTYSICIDSKYFPFNVVFDGVYGSSMITDIDYNAPIPQKNQDIYSNLINDII